MAWIPGCKMPGGESRAHFRRVMRRRVGLATPPQGGKAGKNTSWCLRPAASGKTACLEHCQPEREGGSPPAPPGVSSWLEPCAGKLARTVLRGGAASNGRSLPDPDVKRRAQYRFRETGRLSLKPRWPAQWEPRAAHRRRPSRHRCRPCLPAGFGLYPAPSSGASVPRDETLSSAGCLIPLSGPLHSNRPDLTCVPLQSRDPSSKICGGRGLARCLRATAGRAQPDLATPTRPGLHARPCRMRDQPSTSSSRPCRGRCPWARAARQSAFPRSSHRDRRGRFPRRRSTACLPHPARFRQPVAARLLLSPPISRPGLPGERSWKLIVLPQQVAQFRNSEAIHPGRSFVSDNPVIGAPHVRLVQHRLQQRRLRFPPRQARLEMFGATRAVTGFRPASGSSNRCHYLLWRLLTSGDPSQPLSEPVAAAYQAVRSTRVRRATFSPSSPWQKSAGIRTPLRPPDCVARRSNMPDILAPRALPGGRIGALGATPDFCHGLLEPPHLQ